jgi:type IV pilus assembly protein PilB
MVGNYQRLGNYLISKGLINYDQLKLALEKQKDNGKKLGQTLIDLGFIDRPTLLPILEEQLQIEYVNVVNLEIRTEVAELINERLARKHQILPIDVHDDIIHLAMADPLDIIAIKDVKLATGLGVKTFMSTPIDIIDVIDRIYSSSQTHEMYKEISDELNLAEIEEMDEELLNEINNAPIVKLVNTILSQAVKAKASDIHIEPFDKEIRVRLRVDGALNEYLKPSKTILNAIVTRIKIMASLNIAEHRVPQDGRVETEINGHKVDLRVSILPTIYGEKIVIRLLDRTTQAMTKKQLGFSDDNLKRFENMISKPHGIILVTGPTGSGKTTTLYAALMELNDIEKNIITVEDPVEYRMDGVNQTQVNTKAGLTFASGLRSILRQDPDIIMIGEIRDKETASIAVRAAITGHLVFSTVHTNDTASTIARLVDMGIEPFMLSSSLIGVHAQRLVKKICQNCREKYKANDIEAAVLGVPEGTKLCHGTGCSQCNHTGYKGRTAIHEIMPLTRTLREAINRNKTTEELKDIALEEGMTTMRMSARDFVLKGITTVDELLRLTNSED